MAEVSYYKLLNDVLYGYDRFTPNNISHLRHGQIFVFGTDANGSQRYGAAGLAAKRFGAIIGQNEGLMGTSYALPSMGVDLNRLSQAINKFEDFAREHNNLTFLVTPIGCGHAGFKVNQVAPCFEGCVGLSNVYLPAQFIRFYLNKCKTKLGVLQDSNGNDVTENVFIYYDEKVHPIIKYLLDNNIAFNKDGGFSLLDKSGYS